MSLNIKDPEAHKLAQQLARETGESMTAAVTKAIRERLETIRRRRKREKTLAALIEIGKRGREIFTGPSVDHAEMLYDQNGLPK
jgi:antitoxin VapB